MHMCGRSMWVGMSTVLFSWCGGGEGYVECLGNHERRGGHQGSITIPHNSLQVVAQESRIKIQRIQATFASMALKRPRKTLEEYDEAKRVSQDKVDVDIGKNSEHCRQQAANVASHTQTQCYHLLQCCANARAKQREEGQKVDKICGLFSIPFSACPVHEPKLVEGMRALRDQFRDARARAPAQSPGLGSTECEFYVRLGATSSH